jgi:hypothetical protein
MYVYLKVLDSGTRQRIQCSIYPGVYYIVGIPSQNVNTWYMYRRYYLQTRFRPVNWDRH